MSATNYNEGQVKSSQVMFSLQVGNK